MNSIQSLTLASLLLASPTVLSAANTPQSPSQPVVVADKVPAKAEAFDLSQVQLLDGPFKQAQDLNRQGLLKMDLDLLLYPFRREGKIPSPVKGADGLGWPVTGHTLGHFLSASALLYRNTGDPEIKRRADSAVASLAECQAASGYLGGFPEASVLELEGLVKNPKVHANVPWYCLHKVYAGLLDMYVLTGNQQALEVLRKAAGWIEKNTGQLSDEQMQKMLGIEQGGITEFLANLYSVTGDQNYLGLAARFNHRAVIDPFAKGKDPLDGLHANTQIPKFIGLTREYELTGDPVLGRTAEQFWKGVVEDRTYVTGGNSSAEHFTPKAQLSQAFKNTTETCNEYNMLKLTRHLFCLDPKAGYADYYERTLYNQILSSRRPDGGQLYFQQLATGSDKRTTWRQDPAVIKGNSCCHGTGLESNSKYEDSIYFHQGESELFVNLFIPSVLDWKSRGLTVRQETAFPDQASTKLTFACEQPLELNVNLRRPWWATSNFQVLLNGKLLETAGAPGSYAQVSRAWKSGDTLEVKMPMTFRMEGFKDNPKRAAVMYGPLVMAAIVDPGVNTSVIESKDGRFLEALKPIPGKPLEFEGSPEVFRAPKTGTEKPVRFKPLLRITDEPYAVYWDISAPSGH